LHPNCVAQAVSDLRPDRRDRLMKTYRCNRSYESLEKLILDKEIDAVAIFTDPPQHVKHSIAAMNAGKHVVCAVPACMSLEEAEQLKAAKKRTGVSYMMAETSYYRPYTILARELFKEGAFGEVFYTEVEYYHGYRSKKEADDANYYQGQRTWRYGWPPMKYLTHSSAYVVGVTKERYTEVSCLGWTNPQVNDEFGLGKNMYNNPFHFQVGLFKTSGGYISRAGRGHWAIGTLHEDRAVWHGTKMSLYMPDAGGQPFRVQGPDGPDTAWTEVPGFGERLPPELRSLKTGHGNSQAFLTHEFVTALCQKREPAVGIYESLAMTVPGIVAQESSLKGGVHLKIPSFDETA